jgi:hypothetical protein
MQIRNVFDFNKVIHSPDGPFAWPGGYPMFFLCSDGDALSWQAAVENADQIRDSIIQGWNDGWRVVAFDINWEDANLHCSHTGNRIESAYAEDRELCDTCSSALEPSQIGLCGSCLEEHRESTPSLSPDDLRQLTTLQSLIAGYAHQFESLQTLMRNSLNDFDALYVRVNERFWAKSESFREETPQGREENRVIRYLEFGGGFLDNTLAPIETLLKQLNNATSYLDRVIQEQETA